MSFPCGDASASLSGAILDRLETTCAPSPSHPRTFTWRTCYGDADTVATTDEKKRDTPLDHALAVRGTLRSQRAAVFRHTPKRMRDWLHIANPLVLTADQRNALREATAPFHILVWIANGPHPADRALRFALAMHLRREPEPNMRPPQGDYRWLGNRGEKPAALAVYARTREQAVADGKLPPRPEDIPPDVYWQGINEHRRQYAPRLGRTKPPPAGPVTGDAAHLARELLERLGVRGVQLKPSEQRVIRKLAEGKTVLGMAEKAVLEGLVARILDE